MRRALPLLVAVASLSAAGCGSDDGSTTVTVTAPGTSTSASSSPEPLPPAPPQPSSGAPRGTLKVASDGCGVLRSAFATEPDTLQWSVKDEGGFEVLGRNARGETRYRYYRPGAYTVVLQAFANGEYAPISNVVNIRC